MNLEDKGAINGYTRTTRRVRSESRTFASLLVLDQCLSMNEWKKHTGDGKDRIVARSLASGRLSVAIFLLRWGSRLSALRAQLRLF